MLRENLQYIEFTKNDKEMKSNKIMNFLDGEGFDHFLQFLLKGLYFGMIFFCIPYLCFLLITLNL
ncbi:hypothetical protein [Metabacillus litoralis]|uniref:hypothetical protein n=1 Tax=Metabacillus litoralis TaxID=152268 RepID=UPI001CFF1DFD|nr:hypothetical protein [Metabacillus litoralis]